MAPKNLMLERMKSGRTALGVWANDPETVELCAFLGLDWIMIDMMFTGMDFRDVQNMIRTCEAAGITPVVRAHSDPWMGYDPRIARRPLAPARHRRAIHARLALRHSGDQGRARGRQGLAPARAVGSSVQESRRMGRAHRRDAQGAYIIPHAESLGSVDDARRDDELPDLKMFFFGMTDLSKVIGGTKKPNWDDPKLWEFVDRAVKIGKEKGIVIGANTSYAYTMAEMRQRVKRLKDAGMGFIMIQGAPFLFQVAMTEFLHGVREDLGLA